MTNKPVIYQVQIQHNTFEMKGSKMNRKHEDARNSKICWFSYTIITWSSLLNKAWLYIWELEGSKSKFEKNFQAGICIWMQEEYFSEGLLNTTIIMFKSFGNNRHAQIIWQQFKSRLLDCSPKSEVWLTFWWCELLHLLGSCNSIVNLVYYQKLLVIAPSNIFKK